MRFVYYILLAVSITGCSFLKPKEIIVEVPYPVSCVTWEPTREHSQFANLESNSPLWEQVKALLVDREKDQQFIDGQAAVINGCKD